MIVAPQKGVKRSNKYSCSASISVALLAIEGPTERRIRHEMA